MLRLIKYLPRTAAQNMSLDEVLFDDFNSRRGVGEQSPGKSVFAAVLRTYTWDKPYTTIGYFQKNDCGAVRRLTGGLTVKHKDDLSFSLITSGESWPFVYSENETYKTLHTAVQKALAAAGFETSFLKNRQGLQNNICVQTLCESDLIRQGKKVVGSCMRRRGNKILVQGSVHIILSEKQKDVFHNAFAKELFAFAAGKETEFFNEKPPRDFTRDEIEKAALIAQKKYDNPQWNFRY
jgi:lipoate-protein ligase A